MTPGQPAGHPAGQPVSQNAGQPIAQRIRRTIKWTAGVAVLLAALAWMADWLLLRHKAAQDGEAFGEVEVHYQYAVRLKNKRVEQNPESVQTVECVHSIFPHYDETPCWYLERHTSQIQTLDGRPWRFFYEE
jgi:hypothetical protein